MAHNSQDLKVVSIFQLVMTAVFLILGLVDRFQVRYLYTSFLMTPCWTAAIVSRLNLVARFHALPPSFNQTL